MKAITLAKAAGISPSYLSEVEKGVSAISSEKLLRIAKHLRVTLEYLLEGENSATPLQPPQDINIPSALSVAADRLNLTFNQTLRLLEARKTLRARRSSGPATELETEGWVRFYDRVKDFMEE